MSGSTLRARDFETDRIDHLLTPFVSSLVRLDARIRNFCERERPPREDEAGTLPGSAFSSSAASPSVRNVSRRRSIVARKVERTVEPERDHSCDPALMSKFSEAMTRHMSWTFQELSIPECEGTGFEKGDVCRVPR